MEYIFLKKIKMIVGLGNPTDKFNNTRHNVGSWYISILADMLNLKLKLEKKFFGKSGTFKFYNYKIHLLIPEIYMNLNGISIYAYAYFYKIDLSEILVIHDEIDMFPGTIKMKYSSGHNGHNGVKSIISQFNKKCKFFQLYIGIGRPSLKEEIPKFVLQKPKFLERKMIDKVIFWSVKNIKQTLLYNKLFF